MQNLQFYKGLFPSFEAKKELLYEWNSTINFRYFSCSSNVKIKNRDIEIFFSLSERTWRYLPSPIWMTSFSTRKIDHVSEFNKRISGIFSNDSSCFEQSHPNRHLKKLDWTKLIWPVSKRFDATSNRGHVFFTILLFFHIQILFLRQLDQFSDSRPNLISPLI